MGSGCHWAGLVAKHQTDGCSGGALPAWWPGPACSTALTGQALLGTPSHSIETRPPFAALCTPGHGSEGLVGSLAENGLERVAYPGSTSTLHISVKVLKDDLPPGRIRHPARHVATEVKAKDHVGRNWGERERGDSIPQHQNPELSGT